MQPEEHLLIGLCDAGKVSKFRCHGRAHRTLEFSSQVDNVSAIFV